MQSSFLGDPLVWTLFAACLIIGGIIASRLSGRARREALNARSSERELREIVETIPAVVWSASPDGSNTFVNNRWTEYTGLPADETAGAGWQATVHPEDLPRHLERWQASLSTGEPFEVEVRLHRADGQYRWHYVHAVPLRDEHGKIFKWSGILTDVEQRRRAQEALGRSEAYLAEAQRIAHTGSWAFTPGREGWNYWSDETFRMFEIDPQQGAPTHEVMLQRTHPEDQQHVLERYQRALREKVEYVADFRFTFPGERLKYLHAIGHPVFDDAGEIVEFVGTIIDLTGQRQKDEALRRGEAPIWRIHRGWPT